MPLRNNHAKKHYINSLTSLVQNIFGFSNKNYVFKVNHIDTVSVSNKIKIAKISMGLLGIGRPAGIFF